MQSGSEWKDLASELKVFTRWAISSLIDSAFLAFWVFVQWIASEKVIASLGLSGVDQWMLAIFQVLFAISTLVPIVVYIYVDIRVMLMRAQRRIQGEEKSTETGVLTKSTQQGHSSGNSARALIQKEDE